MNALQIPIPRRSFLHGLTALAAAGFMPTALAKAVADQPEWAKLDAVKGHRVHELTHAAWYLADGGILSMDKMLADAERALGL
jgi:ABC-type Fe3+-hydroxamate transport system substrate-binding protein